MRIARPAVLDRASEGVAHGRRRLEIGLAELEMHHVDPGALELLRPFRDLDGQKRLDLLHSSSEGHGRLPPMRRLACTICQSIPGPWRTTPTLLPA